MSYSSLPSYTQDVIMVQFDFFAKIFLLGMFFVAAIIYINWYSKYKKTKEESPFLLFDFLRMALNWVGYVYIFLSPMFIIWLYPQITIDGLLKGVFAFYRLCFIIIGIILIANVFWYGAHITARLSGVWVFRNTKTDKVLDQFLGKKRKLFDRR